MRVRLPALFPAEAAGGLALATMTAGNFGALGQADVRSLLGWSSVSQSGYALMVVTVVGLTAHALSALLFFLGGMRSPTSRRSAL